MSQQLFSSESVTEGHPDKVCDRISDAILDALLEVDPRSRVAVETMAATGLIHVAGEVTTEAYVEIPEIVRREILSIGYDSSRVGFDGASCGVSVSLDGQSPDIAGGVDEALEVRGSRSTDPRDRLGAGDQGIMFGYACADTPDLMPAPIWLAHRLAKRLTDVRKQGIVEGLRPDGKTQVTLAYDNDRPVGIDTIVVSTQHDECMSQLAVADAVRTHVIEPVIDESGLDLSTSAMKTLINPSGRFVLGGPAADAGLTGRKIIVDTYGGMAAEERFPARIRQRLTAPRPTLLAGSRRTWLPPEPRAAARFSSPTPLGGRTRSACTSTPSARHRLARTRLHTRSARCLISVLSA